MDEVMDSQGRWCQVIHEGFSCSIFLAHDHEFVCSFLSSSLAADIKPEGLKDDVPNSIDKKDEDLCVAKTGDISKDCAQTGSTQEVPSSQQSMDCGSAGELEQSDSNDKNNLAETQFSNGQKSKSPSSPGPQPAKANCVNTDSANPKLFLCLNNSPRKDVSTPSDVEMLSPTSPVSKSTFINCSDKDQDCTTCEQDSSFARSQEVESQDFHRGNNSGCSAKDEVQQVASETEEAEIAETRGACDIIKSPSFANFER